MPLDLPSRRAVVRGVWAAPVVVAVGAAPARASSPPDGLVVDLTSATTPDVTGGAIVCRSTITNQATTATSNLYALLSVTLADAAMWGTTPTASAPGWQVGGATGSAGSRTRTFSCRPTTQLGPSGAADASQPFDPTVVTTAAPPVVPSGSVVVTAYPEIGGTPASDSSAIATVAAS